MDDDQWKNCEHHLDSTWDDISGLKRELADNLSWKGRAPAAVCGHNPILPDGRIGCGQDIKTCSEVYRCVDCGTPFHEECIKNHFGKRTLADRCAEAHAVEIIREQSDRIVLLQDSLLNFERVNNEQEKQLAEKDAALAICVEFIRGQRNTIKDFPINEHYQKAISIIDEVLANLPDPKQACEGVGGGQRVADGPFRQDYEELCQAVGG